MSCKKEIYGNVCSYLEYSDTVRQLYLNIQTILNFYGVNIHGDNHNQNRTSMQKEAEELMLEWVHDYIIDYFNTDHLDDEDIWQLATEVMALFIANDNGITEAQLYVLYVEAILPAEVIEDPIWQEVAMVNDGFNVTEVPAEQILLDPIAPILHGEVAACCT